MTHAGKGKYFEKHSKDSKTDDDLKREIIERVKGNNIACKETERIAGKKGMAIGKIGKIIDILNVNIVECQLGLFGYSPHKKIVHPAKEVMAELKENITSALKDGRLPCSAVWKIAEKLNIPRMKVSAACETLFIKIKPCQLGAF